VVLRWDDAFLTALVGASLLRYLAVAHYGRGRGDWIEAEYPAFWAPLVAQVLDEHGERFANVWAQREAACDVEVVATRVRGLLADVTRQVLNRLYPGALGRIRQPMP
jgi:hypothetical protein